jgi:diaminopimelate dehydrogenase
VIRSGPSGLEGEHRHTVEFRLTLDSNPEFTALTLVALARAVGKHAERGDYGCRTVFDLAPAELSPLSGEELRAHLL